MTRYRVIAPTDPAGRWKHGEVGVALPNDYPEKYDVLLDFGDCEVIDAPGSILHGLRPRRVVYLYADQVEPVPSPAPEQGVEGGGE